MSQNRLPPPESEACLFQLRSSTQKGGTLIAEDVTDHATHERRICDPGRDCSRSRRGWDNPSGHSVEAVGGTVFRRALSDVEDTVDDEDIAAIKADLAQMKAEHAQARDDRKSKIQEKIDQLGSKLQALFQKAKDQRQAAERDAQLKLDALKAKAKAAAAKAGA
jgi:hypothetical protein